MELVGGLIGLALVGALVTAAARFALPGPDPMPVWLMSVIGAIALIVGGSIGYAFAEGIGSVLGAIVCATLILVAYRKVIQRRGITGPDAQRLPTRGIGIRKMRQRWGIDSGRAEAGAADQLRELGELRDRGVITAEEFEAKKAELLERI